MFRPVKKAIFRRDLTKIYTKEGNIINERDLFLTNVLFERYRVSCGASSSGFGVSEYLGLDTLKYRGNMV
jgi:hypothetical protein